MTWEHIVRRWLSARLLIKTSADQIQDHKGNVVSEPYNPSSLESCSESISSTETNEGSEVIRRRRLQTALIVAAKSQYRLVNNFPVPEIQSSDEILIRNHATGLNPIDWKSVDYNFCLPEFPWVTGRECAGIVEEVGADVTSFKRGDRVWTSTYYKDIRAGCFQEYLVVPAHTVCHVPHAMTLEEAACLGVCALTAAVTLWHWLKIPMPSLLAAKNGDDGEAALPSAQAWPPCSDEYILVWGGGSVTGQFAVQLLANAGVRTIVVCSERSASLLTKCGATHIVTRDGKSDEAIVDQVLAIGGDNITRALDLVGIRTVPLCIKCMSSGSPAILAPVALISPSQSVPSNISVANIEMKQFVLNEAFSVYAKELNVLVAAGKVAFPKLEIVNGGLQEVEPALKRLRAGDLCGSKLVISLQK